jgi:hypothetical protein
MISMSTDWAALRFQVWAQAAQALVVVLCSAFLAYWFNRKIERIKAELVSRQTLRDERKEEYFRVLGILAAMRYSVDMIALEPGSKNAKTAFEELANLRKDLYRAAPIAFTILKAPAGRAFEVYRRTAEPALRLDPAMSERWEREANAIGDAIKELVTAAQVDLDQGIGSDSI